MSITRKQAEDLLTANYLAGSWLAHDDPEWWEDMVEYLMEFKSVKYLRHHGDPGFGWRVPPWWPGAIKADDRENGPEA